MKAWRWGLVLGITVLSSTTSLPAWLAEGHRILTFEALTLVAEEVPAFLQEDREAMARDSIDPDLMRDPSLPQLRDREAPDHYLDLELLPAGHLPETRSEYLEHIGGPPVRMGVQQVGTLPYAVVEATQRLAVVFAQLRQRPDDPHLQAKTEVSIAYLAHYAADLCQPLHTTIHHDGRALEDNTSPHTGIHQQVDAMIERMDLEELVGGAPLQPEVLLPLLPAVVEELKRSHQEVDRVYHLATDLAALQAGSESSAELRSLARDRYRVAIRFTASLVLTAWRQSEDLDLPDW